MKKINAFWVGLGSDVLCLLIGVPVACVVAYIINHFLVFFAVFIFAYSIKIYIKHCVEFGTRIIRLKNN